MVRVSTTVLGPGVVVGAGGGDVAGDGGLGTPSTPLMTSWMPCGITCMSIWWMSAVSHHWEIRKAPWCGLCLQRANAQVVEEQPTFILLLMAADGSGRD